MKKGFNEFHAKGEVKIQESTQEFHERVVKHRKVDNARYPDLSREGLEGPYTDLNGKVYYYDTSEGMCYDPDSDVYISLDQLRLP